MLQSSFREVIRVISMQINSSLAPLNPKLRLVHGWSARIWVAGSARDLGLGIWMNVDPLVDPPLKGLNIRIPTTIPSKGRGFPHQSSGLGLFRALDSISGVLQGLYRGETMKQLCGRYLS